MNFSRGKRNNLIDLVENNSIPSNQVKGFDWNKFLGIEKKFYAKMNYNSLLDGFVEIVELDK